MKIIKILFTLLILAFLALESYGQGEFSAHIGPSFPLLHFESDDENSDEAGGAAIGYNVGLKYLHPLGDSGLGIYIGADIFDNGLQKGVKEDVERVYKNLGFNRVNINFYRHINVPITGGVRYITSVDNKTGIFFTGGLALDFLKVTEMTVNIDGQTFKQNVDLSSNLGITAGCGFLLNKFTLISVDYYGFGEHDLTGSVQGPGVTEDIAADLKVDILTVTVGVVF